MARYDDLNTNMIAYAAFLSIVILVIVLQGTQALCYNMISAVDAGKESKGASASSVVKSEQIDSLNGFKKSRIVDEQAKLPAKGEEAATKEVIHIPIMEAQKLILKELGAPAAAPGT